MPLLRSSLPVMVACVLLGACNTWQDRAEFAPPESRWPSTLPSAVPVNAPPPPLAPQFCYRTLAQVDCFAEAKPDRVTGYTGVYPDPDSVRKAP